MIILRSTAAHFDEFINKELLTRNYLIQKFIPEIQTQGEWSIIFFNKKYSHSVLKKAKIGDSRVQEAFGGLLEYTEPPADLISQAQKILSLIPFPLLYARVDGVEIDNILVLMEVELIEPSLFLNHSSKAVNNFINTIIAEIVF